MVNDLYEIKTTAVNLPIRLIEAKAFLRVEHNHDDFIIESLVEAAKDLGEHETNRTFEPVTFTGKFEGLQESHLEKHPFIQLRKGPLISVTTVKISVNGSLVDVPSTDYFLRKTTDYSRMFFNKLLTVDDNVAYPLEIEFVAGYSVLPESILLALKSHILFMYENRGDVSAKNNKSMPNEAQIIYRKNRILNQF